MQHFPQQEENFIPGNRGILRQNLYHLRSQEQETLHKLTTQFKKKCYTRLITNSQCKKPTPKKSITIAQPLLQTRSTKNSSPTPRGSKTRHLRVASPGVTHPTPGTRCIQSWHCEDPRERCLDYRGQFNALMSLHAGHSHRGHPHLSRSLTKQQKNTK